jgi:GNAT superfamily N-acetyltransferase
VLTNEPLAEIGVESSDYRVVTRLRDGTAIIIRAIRADDRDSLRNQFARLSLESIRLRFHGLRRSPTESEALNLTEIDFVEQVALVATLETHQDQLIGIGRYILCAGHPGRHRAEVAFVVLDEYQGRGLGSLLFQHLATIGQRQGLREFQADVLADNRRMIRVLEKSGFPIKRTSDPGGVRLLLRIA